MPQNHPKIPPPVTKERLKRAALRYLERFDSSSGHLKSVLMRRVFQSEIHHQTDRDEASQWIDEIVIFLENANFLNDERYVANRVDSLLARGTSRQMIYQKLKQKQVDHGLIEAALANHAESLTDLEEQAAIAYARRRGLGPWRYKDREMRKDKDLAAMARQGFGYELSRKIIEADTIEMLEEDAR